MEQQRGRYVARVELYNKIGKINGRSCTVGNGFAVARFELLPGGELPRRCARLMDCGTGETAERDAREYAARWNANQYAWEKNGGT